ncbi:hypothetical protein [Rhizobium sp. ZW T2_16]|jgi:hypothetical protein|uniref:hypothetical protein n=1 Tax=Rhizobium sp. ZW T2_16 TaxID=3378083 RepID=UPI000F9DEE6B
MNIITSITASALVGLSAFSFPSAPSETTQAPSSRIEFAEADIACVAKASAFAEVADLAYLYRENGEVFVGAIEELRDQLLDCLATFDDGEGQSAYPAGNRLKLI